MADGEGLPDVGGEVRRLILTRAPSPWTEADLRDDLPIMQGGLGLDSVAVVEVLLACEGRFSISIASDLLAAPDLTVKGLVLRVQSLLSRGGEV